MFGHASQASYDLDEKWIQTELANAKNNRAVLTPKDYIFKVVFTQPEYAFQAYRELFPEDRDAKLEEIQILTVTDYKGKLPYMELGFLVGKRRMVFLGEQSPWSMNLLIRLYFYWVDSVLWFVRNEGYDLDSPVPVPVPDTKSFAINAGETPIESEILSVQHEFYDDDPKQPDFIAHVIQLQNAKGVLREYILFCQIYDAETAKYPQKPQRAIRETIRICKENGYLTKCWEDHEAELEKRMLLYT